MDLMKLFHEVLIYICHYLTIKRFDLTTLSRRDAALLLDKLTLQIKANKLPLSTNELQELELYQNHLNKPTHLHLMIYLC